MILHNGSRIGNLATHIAAPRCLFKPRQLAIYFDSLGPPGRINQQVLQ